MSGMDIRHANRRESDRIPFGVECALPWAPGPSHAAQQPRPKKHPLRTAAFVLVALALVLGLGRGIYVHLKAQLAQDTVSKKA
jgi:uncharacterized protein HemX